MTKFSDMLYGIRGAARRAVKKHNPYFPMVPDVLYQKYENLGGNVNITGAAFEEMAGARDSLGVVTNPEVIALAHTIGRDPNFSGNYLAALEEAKRRLRFACGEDELVYVHHILEGKPTKVKCGYCGCLTEPGDCSRCGAPDQEES